MNEDSKAYSAISNSVDLASYREDLCYYPDTDVPTSTWGLFWLEFDRFNVLCVTLLGVASELSFGVLNNFFSYYLPIFGPSFSTAPLGVIQMMTSASLLSHYQEGFPLGAFWLLFVVGLINLLVGITFRSRMKLRRSIFRSKRQKWEKQAGDGGESGRLDIAKKVIHTLANISLNYTKKKEGTKNVRREQESLLGRPVQPIQSPLDAFVRQNSTSCAANKAATVSSVGTWKAHEANLSATSEMLRELARQENLRIERQQEEREEQKRGLLQDEFQWDAKRGIPIPRSKEGAKLHLPKPNLEERIKRGQAGVSRDLSSISPLPREQGFRAAFQRRSLVLSRVVQQVKRNSAASSVRRKKRMSKAPPLPIAYAKKLTTPRQGPRAWEEVEKSGPSMPPPSNAYRPGRTTVFEDLGSEGGRTRYHSFNTPIANQFSYYP